jgi:hypothetical protein
MEENPRLHPLEIKYNKEHNQQQGASLLHRHALHF